MGTCKLMLLVVVIAICAPAAWGGPNGSKLTLNFRLVPRGGPDGKVTPKLDIDHADAGPVCELQCYETGPFQNGTGVKNEDGSVVFSYVSGNMTCTTTFTVKGDDRVQALVEVKGPLDELKKVSYLGPCLQFQRSKLFTREGPLTEFAGRCFIYTMRGPVKLLDTARGKVTSFKPDAPENNPPIVQWYVPVDRMHPGSIWGVVGAAGDRPVFGLVAVASRDGKWAAGYASRHNLNLGQLYMPCIHVLTDVAKHLDAGAGRIAYKEMIYVTANDPKKLLDAFREDFRPEAASFSVSPAAGGALGLKPSGGDAPALELKLDLAGGDPAGGEWKASWWDTLIRAGTTWRAWAHPHDDALELCVSLKPGAWKPETARAVAKLSGNGWSAVEAPVGVAARVMRTADGKWTAALFWERADKDDPASGVPASDRTDAGAISVRGKLLIGETKSLDLDRRKRWADIDWEHAVPYRMPADDPAPAAEPRRSTEQERKDFIKGAKLCEEDPLSENAAKFRAWAVKWIEEVEDVKVVMYADVILPLYKRMPEDYEFRHVIFMQYLIACGVYAIEHDQKETDAVELCVQALQSCVAVYRAIIKDHPEHKVAAMDDLAKVADDKKLADYVKQQREKRKDANQ